MVDNLLACPGRLVRVAGSGVREADDFDGYVAVAWPRLLRSAWLLTGDWQLAEDLLQTALVKTFLRWRRLYGDNPDGYVRRVLATTYLSWWRRRWRAEVPVDTVPELVEAESVDRMERKFTLEQALAMLPARQRAVLMLRFHADQTEMVTAATLGITVGTVKSHTARALATLRANPQVRALLSDREPEEVCG